MVRGLLIILSGVLLAGCADRGPPLHSPYEASHRYGYRERALAPDLYHVEYIGPVRYLPAHPGNRPVAVEEAVRVAGELALLRAAELAAENGYPHLEVEGRQSDLEIRHVREVEDPPFHHHPYYRYPYWHPYYYPYGFPHHHYPLYVREYTLGRASVKIQVRLLREAGENSFETAATIERLRARYIEQEDGQRRGR